jgi:ribosomal protein S18 acetylase RimI-like enzyme
VNGHPLDNPIWTALTGPQRDCAEQRGAAARYRDDIAPFAGLAGGAADPDPAAWADLAGLVGPGGLAVLSGEQAAPPAGWRVVETVPGVQMDGSGVESKEDPEAVVLGDEDVVEMLGLVDRTRPGPFREQTHLLGGYRGFRVEGGLVAMAGQRFRPPGWTEISAVCTDPAYRGRGLADRLVRAVAAGAVDRGETPFLHAAASNTGAVRLYEWMGFRLRRTVIFSAVRAPR